MFVAVILLLSFIYPSWTLEGDNVCHKNTSKSGKIVSHKECCFGFMEKNNKCIECLPGFWGKYCNTACPENHYGSKCNSVCQCDSGTEYCHPVCGCVAQTPVTGNSTTDYNSSHPVPTECLTSSDDTQTSNDIYRLDTTATNGLHSTNIEPSIRHDVSDGGDVENRDDDNHNDVDHTYGYSSHLSDEQSCYSTLTLRVNRGSLYTSNTTEHSVTTSMDDNPYGIAFCRRNEDKHPNNFDCRDDASKNEMKMMQGATEDGCYVYNSLLRHYTIRRFDLTPDDANNATATQIEDDRHYELAGNILPCS